MGDPERLQLVRPLGADRATFVARDTSSGQARLVIVERVTRASPTPQEREELLRRARALAALEHPKVVRVRDVIERAGEVLAVSDYVDGEWLSTLMRHEPRPPIEMMLRVVLDILEGLGALHDLRDERDQPMRFVHGAIGPDAVLVADDGVAEIAHACRAPRPGTVERYVPPELRRGDGVPDVRSDVYGVGAILRDVLADAPADAKWAEPLTDIAWRACSVDPDNRWPSAATMATTVRRIAGTRLATASAVATFVRQNFGVRMHARRTALDLLDETGPPSAEPISVRPSDIEVMDPPSFPSVVQTMPPPVPVKVARVTLVKRSAEMADHDVLEPDAAPRVGTVTQQGLAAAPPPTVVPDAASEQDLPTEAYRRRMPTFPTLDETPPAPPRRSAALQGTVIAAAMVLTFLVGWWTGRTYSPATEAPVCPSATMAAATRPPLPAIPLATGTATATTTATAPTTTTTTATATAPAPATATATATTTTTTTATTTPPTPPAWAVAPPHPTSIPAPAPQPPAATVSRPAPTPAPSAKPAPSAGYVPSEL